MGHGRARGVCHPASELNRGTCEMKLSSLRSTPHVPADPIKGQSTPLLEVQPTLEIDESGLSLGGPVYPVREVVCSGSGSGTRFRGSGLDGVRAHFRVLATRSALLHTGAPRSPAIIYLPPRCNMPCAPVPHLPLHSPPRSRPGGDALPG